MIDTCTRIFYSITEYSTVRIVTSPIVCYEITYSTIHHTYIYIYMREIVSFLRKMFLSDISNIGKQSQISRPTSKVCSVAAIARRWNYNAVLLSLRNERSNWNLKNFVCPSEEERERERRKKNERTMNITYIERKWQIYLQKKNIVRETRGKRCAGVLRWRIVHAVIATFLYDYTHCSSCKRFGRPLGESSEFFRLPYA